MKTAAHVAANILAIGALSVAAGSAQSSGGERSRNATDAAVVNREPEAPVRSFLSQRADRGEDRFLTTTTTTTTTARPVTARALSRGTLPHTKSPSVGSATTPTSSGDSKMFIYNHESTNNPCAYYPRKSDCGYTGHAACGLGGANPCDKLRAVCLLSDYACQDDWFTNSYMIPRYGSWENAKAFWLGHGYW